MWGLRRQASLLIEHGHSQARRYPLAMLWEESQLVVERINQMEVTRAILLQHAAGSIVSKKGQKAFQKLLKELSPGGQE